MRVMLGMILVLGSSIGAGALLAPMSSVLSSATFGAVRTPQRTKRLQLSMGSTLNRRPERNKPSDDGGESWMKNLLLESSVASVVYYLLEFRDDLTPQWLKQFTKDGREIKTIGWEKHLGMLMRAEPEEMIVRRLSQRPLGGSGNNPYLSPNRSAMEYNVLIEPVKIAKNIMKVREQISDEWISDLALVEAENFELTRHREESLGLEKEIADRFRQMVFDHDPLNPAGTPYRGKNYKTLLDYVTKVAMRNYQSKLRISGDRYTLNWLERFLNKNDVEEGPKLKSNALLEAILDGPIVMVTDPRTDKVRMIDPFEIGRNIMMYRENEAEYLMKVLKTVRSDHSELNRKFLEERMKDTIGSSTLQERRQHIVDATPPDTFPSKDSIQGDEADFDV